MITYLFLLCFIFQEQESDQKAEHSRMACHTLKAGTIVGDVRIRKPSPSSDDLLVSRWRQVLYYHSKERRFERVDFQVWRDATGETTGFDIRPDLTPGVFEKITNDFRFVVLNENDKSVDIPARKVISTKGRWAVSTNVSATARYRSVISRDTKPTKTNRKEPAQHYLEFVSYPEGEPIGGALNLPLTSASDIGTILWSSDDMFSVFYTEDGATFCVIEVAKNGKR